MNSLEQDQTSARQPSATRSRRRMSLLVASGSLALGLAAPLLATPASAAGGTVTAARLPELVAGPEGAAFGALTSFKDQVCFGALREDDTDAGRQLWCTAPSGVSRQITDLAQHGTDGVQGLTVVGGWLYFSARTASGTQLFRTDGSSNGVTQISHFTGLSTGDRAVTMPTAVGGVLYFRHDRGNGLELWKTSGQEPVRVADLAARGASLPGDFRSFKGSLVFTARDGWKAWRLWTSDGTEEGTVPLNAVRPGRPSELTVAGSTLFFLNGTKQGRQRVLWKSDGTRAGTVKVPGMRPFIRENRAHQLVAAGKRVVFTGKIGSARETVWISNGTKAGTRALVRGKSKVMHQVRAVLGRSVVVQRGKGLWKVPISGGSFTSLMPRNPRVSLVGGPSAVVGGRLFLAATDSTRGPRLWSTDGGQMRPVVALTSRPDAAERFQMTGHGNRLYFTTHRADTGWELWRTSALG